MVGNHHPLIVRGIVSFLDSIDDIEVVTVTATGPDALAAMRQHKPDVALIEITLPGKLTGADLAAAVVSEELPTRIILFANSEENWQGQHQLDDNVYGILFRESSPEELLGCVRGVADGRKIWPPSRPDGDGRSRFSRSEQPTDVKNGRELTRRENEVLQMVARGLSNKEIARRLVLSEGTVKLHVHNILRKLGRNSRAALAAHFKSL